ncbi:hypothetical protein D9M69_663120 [compost metagenome]
MEHRKFKDTYENEAKLNQAKSNYSRAIANYTGSIIQIPATRPINEIHEEILKATLEIYE